MSENNRKCPVKLYRGWSDSIYAARRYSSKDGEHFTVQDRDDVTQEFWKMCAELVGGDKVTWVYRPEDGGTVDVLLVAGDVMAELVDDARAVLLEPASDRVRSFAERFIETFTPAKEPAPQRKSPTGNGTIEVGPLGDQSGLEIWGGHRLVDESTRHEPTTGGSE